MDSWALFCVLWCMTMLSTMISVSTLLLLSSTCIWLFTIPVQFYWASILTTTDWVTATSPIVSSMTATTSMTIAWSFHELELHTDNCHSIQVVPILPLWMNELGPRHLHHWSLYCCCFHIHQNNCCHQGAEPTMTTKASMTTAVSTVFASTAIHSQFAFCTYNYPTKLHHANEALALRNGYKHP